MRFWKRRDHCHLSPDLGRLREGNSAGKETSAKSEEKASTPAQRQQASLEEQNNDALSPAIRRLLAEHNLEASAIKGTGVGGRLTREDVENIWRKASLKHPLLNLQRNPLWARAAKTRANDPPAQARGRASTGSEKFHRHADDLQ